MTSEHHSVNSSANQWTVDSSAGGEAFDFVRALPFPRDCLLDVLSVLDLEAWGRFEMERELSVTRRVGRSCMLGRFERYC